MPPKPSTYQVFYDGLKNFLPEQSLDTVVRWLIDYKVSFKVSRKRISKLGDYRPPYKGKGHRISVNGDLNKYAFLSVVTHEIAHLVTFQKFGRKAAPHGIEWKWEFKKLMDVFLGKNIFPEDVETALLNYMNNPAASSCTDTQLMRAFKNHDPKATQAQDKELPYTRTLVENLPVGKRFCTHNGRVFIKGNILRKRYKCQELKTKRWYAFNPIAEVYILKDKKEEKK